MKSGKQFFSAGHRKNLALLLLAAVCLLCGILFGNETCASAAPENLTTVRVGYFYNGDFMHKEDDGTFAGYDIEYYYTIAGYANWKIEFVEYKNLNDAQDAMEAGEVDIMSGLSKTPERESRFLISSQKMCTSHIAVQVRADDDRFTAGDLSTMTDLTCGILKGSNVVKLYTDWCTSSGLTPHVVEYNSLQERNAALASGEVDAVAAGSTIEGAQKIAEFPSLDLYFMLNRNQGKLKSELDRAMSVLALQNPTYTNDLFEKYFPISRNTEPSYSAQEKAFIAAHPVMKVAVFSDDAPFSSENKGQTEGIIPEYFAHLSELTGITFQCVPYASKEEIYAALSAGDVDVIGKAENDILAANANQVILSDTYLEMNLVQITRAGTRTITEAAVPKYNYAGVKAILKNAGSTIRLTGYGNSAESFQALKEGKADAVICTQPAATWLLNRNRASDYVVSAFAGDPWKISCAFDFTQDGNQLRAIIDKAISVDGSYISQLIVRSTLEDSANLSNIMDRLPLQVSITLIVILIILLILTVIALVIILHRRDVERKLTAQKVELAAAVEANKARHDFFGTVSHDMRTPLNGIVGFTDLALESSSPAQVRDYLSKIKTSGAVLNGLVNDMLIMSRIENGKYQLKPGAFHTDEIFAGVLEPVRIMAAKKEVHFTDNLSEVRHRRVYADQLSLQKIFLNLLSNAVKFTPPGGTVTLHYELDPQSGLQPDSVITVSDTGSGMSEEFLPHVFEPFAQENGMNADTSGSGMGLSIVKSIVDAMGGTISVSSRKGAGTTFTVRLHLEEIPEENAAKAGKEDMAGKPAFAGRKALVCEDNALNLEILRTILVHQGMEVVGKENGKLGLEAYEASAPGEFSCIFLDLRMPVMDGKTTAIQIRALDRADAKDVPIFAVSADAFQENVEECLAAGMNAHIAKPINVDQLLETLHHYL